MDKEDLMERKTMTDRRLRAVANAAIERLARRYEAEVGPVAWAEHQAWLDRVLSVGSDVDGGKTDEKRPATDCRCA